MLLEGLALLGLHRTGEAVRAFSYSLAAADALLALADKNVAALQARALALSALAVATSAPARATEAEQCFALAPYRHQRCRCGRRHRPPARYDRRARQVWNLGRHGRRAGPVMCISGSWSSSPGPGASITCE